MDGEVVGFSAQDWRIRRCEVSEVWCERCLNLAIGAKRAQMAGESAEDEAIADGEDATTDDVKDVDCERIKRGGTRYKEAQKAYYCWAQSGEATE